MHPSGDLDDGTCVTAILVELAIASIAVGLQESAVAGEMRTRSLALLVWRVEVDGGRRITALPVAVITRIHPQSPGLCPARARCQHRQRHIVGIHLGGCKHMIADMTDERLQQPASLADPIRHRREIALDAVAGVDLGLAVER